MRCEVFPASAFSIERVIERVTSIRPQYGVSRELGCGRREVRDVSCAKNRSVRCEVCSGVRVNEECEVKLAWNQSHLFMAVHELANARRLTFSRA